MSTKKIKEMTDPRGTKSKKLVKRLKEMRSPEGKILLTPAMAEEIAGYNFDNYRPVIPNKVSGIAASITNGKFVAMPSDHITLQVGKYTLEHGLHKGEIVYLLLINAQHRIYACIKAGLAIDIYLTFCDAAEGQKALPYMDGGTLRTAAQYIAREYTLPLDKATPASSIARLMYKHQQYAGLKSRSTQKVSVIEVFEEFMKGKNPQAILGAVEITLGTRGRKGVGKLLGINAAYKTALAKGLRIFTKKRMEEFHRQFCLGECTDPETDKSAKLLSNYYATNFASYRGGGERPTLEYYKRCEWAIRAFGDKENVTEINAAVNAGQYLPL